MEAVALAAALVFVAAQRDRAERSLGTLRVQNWVLLKGLPVNGYKVDLPAKPIEPYRVDITW
jgi:hypothetical protein